MPSELVIDGRSLTVDDVVRVARTPDLKVRAGAAALAALGKSRAAVERAIARGDVLYGVNTG